MCFEHAHLPNQFPFFLLHPPPSSLLDLKKIIYFYFMCINVVLYIHVCTTCVPGTTEVKKLYQIPLELRLQKVMSHQVGAQNWTFFLYSSKYYERRAICLALILCLLFKYYIYFLRSKMHCFKWSNEKREISCCFPLLEFNCTMKVFLLFTDANKSTWKWLFLRLHIIDLWGV